MLKLYKQTPEQTFYWEFWDNENGSWTIHWGVLGEVGEHKTIRKEDEVKEEEQTIRNDGYKEGQTSVLIVEYTLSANKSEEDVEKMYLLEDQLNEMLGWTGLGDCESKTDDLRVLEIECNVINFNLAKEKIEEELNQTIFSNYNRIYMKRE